MNENKVLIAVIAFNEEASIEGVLNSLEDRFSNYGYEIIVIDDASTDRTAEIAKEKGYLVLRHCINTRNGMSTVCTYLNYAAINNYDVVCQFDGDGQHNADDLLKLISKVEDEDTDYVIGSRFIENEGFQSFLFRRLGIKLFSSIVSKLIRTKITDVTSGLRAYSGKFSKNFRLSGCAELDSPVELILLAAKFDSKIVEVPVRMKERLSGESEFNFSRSIIFPFTAMITVFFYMIRRY